MASISTSTRGSSPWSLLPAELLEIISQKIADISDFARFRCVCRAWRLAARPHNLSPQLPWLLLPYDPTVSSRSFFSLSTRSTYSLDLPETLNRNIHGSSNGWFLMSDKTLNVSLFNPLTRSLIHLPPITRMPPNYAWRFGRVGDCYIDNSTQEALSLKLMEFYFDFYAFVSPSVDEGVVVFMVLHSPQIQYWRPGNADWIEMDLAVNNLISTMSFYKGKLFVVYENGSSEICDLGPQGKGMPVPLLLLDFCFGLRYLVNLPGELLLVSCHKTYSDPTRLNIADPSSICELSFQYHKLDERDGRMSWSRADGVGDFLVFVIDGMAMLAGNLMPVVCSLPSRRGSCLYYGIPERCYQIGDESNCQMNILTIEGGRRYQFGVPWETSQPDLLDSSWIIPSLY